MTKKTNALYQSIFSSIIDAALLLSPKGKVLLANVAAEEMFRQSQETLLKRSYSDLFPNQKDINEKFEETLNKSISFRDFECNGYRKINDHSFPVSLTISIVTGKENKHEGVLMVARDLSLKKELEETSRQSDYISNLGILTLGMAHEIKNPLSSICASAQLLIEKIPENEQEYLEVVIKESHRINRMVEKMLDFARPSNLDLHLINIHQLLEEILLLEKAQCKGKVKFVQNYDPSLPLVEADEDQLKQALLNLIRNSIEAMADGGSLQLTTRFNSSYSVKPIKGKHSHHDIVIELIDTGIGIDPKDLEKLFTPFHTTKSKGTGLGLSLSLKIIEDHSGKIKIFSEKNKGTQVKVFLPIKQEKDG